MFDFGIVGAVAEIQMQMAQEKQFYESLKDLPPENMIAALERRKETLQEQAKERRHRELIDAVRASKPRGIGIFW